MLKYLLICTTIVGFFGSNVSAQETAKKAGRGDPETAMVNQFVKQLEPAGLSQETTTKIKENFTKTVKEVMAKRKAVNLTPQMLKDRAEASKKAREDGKKGICYDFQNKGKCSRDKCKFSHDSKDDRRRRSPSRERDRDRSRGRDRDKDREWRPKVKVPDGACENLKKGKCDTKDCPALHGKFNPDSRRECWNERDKKFCYNLFSDEGCRFQHSDGYAKN